MVLYLKYLIIIWLHSFKGPCDRFFKRDSGFTFSSGPLLSNLDQNQNQTGTGCVPLWLGRELEPNREQYPDHLSSIHPSIHPSLHSWCNQGGVLVHSSHM